MKFSSSESKVLLREMRKILTTLGKNTYISDRTSVTIDPKGRLKTNFDVKLNCHMTKFREILFFMLLSFYLPKEYQVYFRVLIQEQKFEFVSNWNQKERLSICTDLETTEKVVLDYFKTPDELFGWLKQPRKLKIKFDLKLRRDNRVYGEINHSRHRGYRDKGSLGKAKYLTEEVQKDLFIQEAENELQKRIKKSRDLSDFIQRTDLFG